MHQEAFKIEYSNVKILNAKTKNEFALFEVNASNSLSMTVLMHHYLNNKNKQKAIDEKILAANVFLLTAKGDKRHFIFLETGFDSALHDNIKPFLHASVFLAFFEY